MRESISIAESFPKLTRNVIDKYIDSSVSLAEINILPRQRVKHGASSIYTMPDKRNRRHVLAIRGNEIVVKIVFHSFPWTARAPFGKRGRRSWKCAIPLYAEDVPPWLHVPPPKRRDGDQPVEVKEIKQRGVPARNEREREWEREGGERRWVAPREKRERKNGNLISICNQCLLCLAARWKLLHRRPAQKATSYLPTSIR